MNRLPEAKFFRDCFALIQAMEEELGASSFSSTVNPGELVASPTRGNLKLMFHACRCQLSQFAAASWVVYKKENKVSSGDFAVLTKS